MKQYLTSLAAVMAAVGVGSVFAASSVDLSVVGSITPAACTPMLSSGGIVDYGKLSVQDLHPGNETKLPDAVVQLTVSCDASTLMAIKSTDNRDGTSSELNWAGSSFGLGLAAGDKKVGWYHLKMTNAAADDVPRAVIESIDGRTWLDAPENTIWQPKWMRTFNGASSGAPAPLPLQVLKTDVVISTTLSRKSQLPITEEIQIDGSATLDVVYL